MEDQAELLRALREYERTGLTADIREILEASPDLARSCSHGYPQKHRVFDIIVGDRQYSVARCCSCNERVALVPNTTGFNDSPGVPLWVTGRYLRAWLSILRIMGEKTPVDWATLRTFVDSRTDEQIDQDLRQSKQRLDLALRNLLGL